jgi:hypothetical protein
MDPVQAVVPPLAPTPPPVIDYARQARIAEVIESAGQPFSVFNIVALVIIAITIFFLYRRYKDKHATERAHMVRPSPIIETPPVAPVVVDEVKEE